MSNSELRSFASNGSAGKSGAPRSNAPKGEVSDASAAEELQRQDNADVAEAIKRSLAVYEFSTDGTILDANENFLILFRCSLSDIKGKHIQIFTDPKTRSADATHDFWEKIRTGQFVTGDFKRMALDGSEVFIQASYNPIFDKTRNPYKVIAFAMDITRRMKAREKMEQVLVGVAECATELVASSRGLSALSQQMSATAEETSAQANTVAAASLSATSCSKTNSTPSAMHRS